MVFDFAALPPEINSASIYTGPGSAPMMAAAAAYNNLAAELSTTATASQSVITQLTGDEWVGPSAAAMAAAAEPLVAWTHATAAAVQQAAAQAAASAAAYEAAYAMTVPPPVIAANRAQLAALVATNVLGQNTPAIAATEAHYLEMWAQDAAAMYGYAAASAVAGKLAPLVPPAPAANPAGLGAQAAAVSQAGTQSGLTGLVSALPGAVQSLASPVTAAAVPAQSVLDPISSFFNDSLVVNVGQAIFDIGAWNMFASIAAGVLTQQVQVPFHAGPGCGRPRRRPGGHVHTRGCRWAVGVGGAGVGVAGRQALGADGVVDGHPDPDRHLGAGRLRLVRQRRGGRPGDDAGQRHAGGGLGGTARLRRRTPVRRDPEGDADEGAGLTSAV